MPARLVSRPIDPDLQRHFSPTHKLQNEIKALTKLIPTERELEYLAQTHSPDDVSQVLIAAQSIRQKIAALQEERQRLTEDANERRERQAKERSQLLLRERQDEVIVEWITKEAAAIERVHGLVENSVRRVASRRSQLTSRLHSAEQCRAIQDSEKLDRLLVKQEEWMERVEEIDRTKERDALRRSHECARDQVERQNSAAAAASLHARIAQEESAFQEQQSKHKLRIGNARRQFHIAQRIDKAHKFGQRYPVHTSEVDEQRRRYFEEKLGHVEAMVDHSRERRKMVLDDVVKSHMRDAEQRAASAREKSSRLHSAADALRRSKLNKLQERFDALRKDETTTAQRIERERQLHSVELSFKARAATPGDEISDKRGIAVADRWIEKLVHGAQAHGVLSLSPTP